MGLKLKQLGVVSEWARPWCRLTGCPSEPGNLSHRRAHLMELMHR